MENKKKSEFFDPRHNPDVIAIWKDTDGNYKGLAQKNGKMIDAREVAPEYVLQKLLTHE